MGALSRRLCLLVAVHLYGCGGGATSNPNGDTAAPKDECEAGRCLEDIARVVKEHRDKARACYDARLEKDPTLKGNRLLINFAIEADGTVSDASQSVKGDQIEDAEVVACVTDVIKQITFAKSAAGKRTRAYHSFEFNRRAKQ